MAEIKRERKKNKDKNVERRLRTIQLRGEGINNKEIAAMIGVHPKVVSRWVCAYTKGGIKAVLKGERKGNHRNLSFKEEQEFINMFKEKAERGECVTAKEIKIAYCEKIGHTCGKGQIYRVLQRQNWRKVVPRKEHPGKASEVEIEASKKLTFG